MRRRKLIVLAALIPAFMVGVTGCDGGVEATPCKRFIPIYHGMTVISEPDGEEVEYEGRPALCEDGEPVAAGLDR